MLNGRMKPLPVETYNPTKLDCEQWVRVAARDAEFRYVLLITKHHDGFYLWDSQYTDYDVASSPVKTDALAEVSKACKKYGLQFAVYYLLWDRHEPTYKDNDPQKYINYINPACIDSIPALFIPSITINGFGFSNILPLLKNSSAIN